MWLVPRRVIFSKILNYLVYGYDMKIVWGRFRKEYLPNLFFLAEIRNLTARLARWLGNLAAVQCVVDSIPIRNNYLSDPQIVVLGFLSVMGM